jgi:hypothetical protein
MMAIGPLCYTALLIGHPLVPQVHSEAVEEQPVDPWTTGVRISAIHGVINAGQQVSGRQYVYEQDLVGCDGYQCQGDQRDGNGVSEPGPIQSVCE